MISMRFTAFSLLVLIGAPSVAAARKLDGNDLNVLAVRNLSAGKCADALRVARRAWTWCEMNHRLGEAGQGMEIPVCRALAQA